MRRAASLTFALLASSVTALAQDRPAARKEPVKPKDLQRFITGDEADLDVRPAGPALLLMGGGGDVDHAFTTWREFVAGGDVVVLRTSGSDGYNAYLFDQIGGFDSVETLLVNTRAFADSAWVARRLEQAEGIFIAGGDQATYVKAWKGTGVDRALHAAWRRGAALGGTSAGAAILGRFSFTAMEGTITSTIAARDPYHSGVTLDAAFLRLPFLDGALVDTHFHERDREGRLLAFMGRIVADQWHEAPLGIGIDEGTALTIARGGRGRVYGKGKVTLYRALGPPPTCRPGAALSWTSVGVWSLRRNDTVDLPAGPSGEPPATITVIGGVVRELKR